jgi:hypothetical protein
LPGAGHGFGDADAQKAQAGLVVWFEETLIRRPQFVFDRVPVSVP